MTIVEKLTHALHEADPDLKVTVDRLRYGDAFVTARRGEDAYVFRPLASGHIKMWRIGRNSGWSSFQGKADETFRSFDAAKRKVGRILSAKESLRAR